MSNPSSDDKTRSQKFHSNASDSPNVSQFQKLPPLNCPPPITNQNFPPYSFTAPPPFYPIPPTVPYMGHNLPYNFYPPVNIPPPSYTQNFVPPYTSEVRKDLPNIKEEEIKEEVLFPNAVKRANIVSEVKLWEVSKYFRKFHSLLKDLENELNTIIDENVDMEAEQCINEIIINKQEKLIAHKNSMNIDPTLLICLKYKINKRKKKRKYRKRMKKSKSHILVHEVANMHMQQLQQDANNIKQEEKLKQEADNILSSVVQKKADARYQIQLLSNLLKLHSARVHKLTVETKLTVDDSIAGFEKVLEKLKNLWETKLCEYTAEEDKLKSVIDNLAVSAEDEDCMKLEKAFEKWLKFMFGTENLQRDKFYSSYDQLIEIRQGWDKYVVDQKYTRGSKIPAGWVIPKYNDNEAWKQFLFQ